MPSNFKYTLLSCLRNPALLFWPLAFPIIMSLLFHFMFANLEGSYELQPVDLAVVADEAYDNAPGLAEALAAVDGDPASERHIVNITEHATEAEALAAVRDGAAQAYLTVDANNDPQLHVPSGDITESGQLYLTAVRAVLDGYVRVRREVEHVAEEDPSLLLGPVVLAQLPPVTAQVPDPENLDLSDFADLITENDRAGSSGALGAFLTDAVTTKPLKLTRSDPDPKARYFYALLGMASGLAATIAFTVVHDLQARGSALGARRAMAGIPRIKLLASAAAAAWLLAYACLVAGFAFMRLVLGVNFGDRVGACVLGLGVSSLAFCALGALLGTFPKLQPSVLTAITMPLCFFAGLYGTASQRAADRLALQAPALSAANPVRQTTQLFYSLLYYDSLDRFWGACLVLLGMALLFGAAGASRMRRVRHASL